MKLNFFNCSEMNARQTEIKKSNSLQNKFLPINDFLPGLNTCALLLCSCRIVAPRDILVDGPWSYRSIHTKTVYSSRTKSFARF